MIPVKLTAGFVIVLWVSLTFAGFWHFEAQYFRPADRPVGAAIVDPTSRPMTPVSDLKTSAGLEHFGMSEPVTLLNFWDAYCPCSRFEEAHVKSLMSHFAPYGVRFITVVEGAPGDDALKRWSQRGFGAMAVVGDTDGSIARKFGVWAAPAAVVLNSRGYVTYIGAYHPARFCDSPQSAWAEQAIAATLQGIKPRIIKSGFYGCQVLPETSSLSRIIHG